jgi:trehalose 6-phosphate phosphatase
MSLPEPLSAAGSKALQAIINSPSDTLIATGFDGTLVPIVEDPAQAYADPSAVAALGRLGPHVGRVVVITGREARTAVHLGGFREVPGLGSMIVLGQYGVERWNAVHDEYILPPEPPQMSAVAEELPEVVDSVGLAGVRIEYKGRAVAVHTRCCQIRKVRLSNWRVRFASSLLGTGWWWNQARRCGRSARQAWTRVSRCDPSLTKPVRAR